MDTGVEKGLTEGNVLVTPGMVGSRNIEKQPNENEMLLLRASCVVLCYFLPHTDCVFVLTIASTVACVASSILPGAASRQSRHSTGVPRGNMVVTMTWTELWAAYHGIPCWLTSGLGRTETSGS